jgi:hypothetical protein
MLRPLLIATLSVLLGADRIEGAVAIAGRRPRNHLAGIPIKREPGIIKHILQSRDEELNDDKIEEKLQGCLAIIGQIDTTTATLFP